MQKVHSQFLAGKIVRNISWDTNGIRVSILEKRLKGIG
jgi:hypothetical protein